MKSTLNESLIKGYFDKETAIDILTTLFESKIHLHNVKTFNRFIRTGSASPEDSSRKVELKLSLERLLELLQKIDSNHQTIQIDCEVVLTLHHENSSSTMNANLSNNSSQI